MLAQAFKFSRAFLLEQTGFWTLFNLEMSKLAF